MSPEAPLVMVVDDDPAILGTVENILLFEGYRTLIAHNGAQALDLLAQRTPAVILLDMRMPEVDGWEFAEELKRRGVDIPVVVMTAARNARQWASEISARAYVEKPFDLDHLLETIASVLPQH